MFLQGEMFHLYLLLHREYPIIFYYKDTQLKRNCQPKFLEEFTE